MIDIKKFFKILFFNTILFLLFLIIFELIFGYFLKKNNFGYLMRSERQKSKIYEVIHNNQKYRFSYKRNFYGFRGDDVKPSEIKIVFEGGSTGNQKFTPEELTIVGLLNNKLNQLTPSLKIINASTDGKTVRGYSNDFKYWFPKLNNFNPKYIIFYTGINDTHTNHPEKFDNPWREDTFSKILDYIKNNSKLVELLKKVKFKYFNKEIHKKYGMTKINDKLYKDYIYIDYQTAVKKNKNNKVNLELVQQFEERLELLNYYMNSYNFIPIFITQVMYNGLENYSLFQINETLKKFCKKNNYSIIKLDEMINDLEINSFYDSMHTTPKGNKVIADKIFSRLIEIINKN